MHLVAQEQLLTLLQLLQMFLVVLTHHPPQHTQMPQLLYLPPLRPDMRIRHIFLHPHCLLVGQLQCTVLARVGWLLGHLYLVHQGGQGQPVVCELAIMVLLAFGWGELRSH